MITKQKFSTKTLSIALAAGLAVVVPQQVPNFNIPFSTPIAYAATLSESTLSDFSFTLNKSGASVDDLDPVEPNRDAITAFKETHGSILTMSFDFNIPDTAVAGDIIEGHLSGGLYKLYNNNNIVAQTPDGSDIAEVLFTSEKNFEIRVLGSTAQHGTNRSVSFEVPLEYYWEVNSWQSYPTSSSQHNQPADPHVMSVDIGSYHKDLLIFKKKYTDNNIIYTYKVDRTSIYAPTTHINQGTTEIPLRVRYGFGDWKTQDNGSDADSRWDDTLTMPPEVPATRDAVYLISIEGVDQADLEFDSIAFYCKFDGHVYDKSTREVATENFGTLLDYTVEPVDQAPQPRIERLSPTSFKVVFEDVPSTDSSIVNLSLTVPYEQNKEVTVTNNIETVGEPPSSFDSLFSPELEQTFTLPSPHSSGNSTVVKDIRSGITVNGSDSSGQSSPVLVYGGSAPVVIPTTNHGNVGTTGITVEFPSGVTNQAGESSAQFDFGDEGFAPNSTKEFDLGKLILPDGRSSYEFTLKSPGYEDWTVTAHVKHDVDTHLESVENLGDGRWKFILNDTDNDNLTQSYLIAKMYPGEGIQSIDTGDSTVTITDWEGNSHEIPLNNDENVNVTVETLEGTKVLIVQEGDRIVRIPVMDTHIEDITRDSSGDYVITLDDGHSTWSIKSGEDLSAFNQQIKDMLLESGVSSENISKELSENIQKLSEDSNSSLKDEVEIVDSNLTLNFTEVDSKINDIEECVSSPHLAVPSIIATLSGIVALSQIIRIPAIDNLARQVPGGNPQIAKFIHQNGPLIGAGISALGLLGVLLIPGLCNSPTLAESDDPAIWGINPKEKGSGEPSSKDTDEDGMSS